MTQPAEPRHRWSLPVGRIGGIGVRIHASFALLVVLVIATSASVEGGTPAALGWLAAVFLCVLLHELAHCVVARRRGVGVDEIMLLPIGGVSRMQKMPEAPRDELAIAIAGPLASGAIAVAAGALAVWSGRGLLPVDLLDGPWLTRLCWFNLLVGGFNLLPAFPLDGGRVLRAGLERRMDRETATRHAARLGRSMAVVFVVAGLLLNLWLVLIGVFVYMGASAEEAATVLHERLAGRRVDDVMLLDPLTLSSTSSVSEAAGVLRHTAQRTFPVLADGRYAGLVDASILESSDPGQTVGDLVDRSAPVMASRASVEDDALPVLSASPHHALAVVDGEGTVVGLLRTDDVRHAVEHRRPSRTGGA